MLQCGATTASTDNTTAFQNGITALINNFGGGTLQIPASFAPGNPGAPNCYTIKSEVTLPTFSPRPTTATSGTGGPVGTATITVSGYNLYPVGSLITVSGVTPLGYNQANATVITSTPGVSSTTVSYQNNTTGSQTVSGFVAITGNPWDQGNPFRINGDGPVQTCVKFTANGTGSSGTAFAFAQPTIGGTTHRGQNAGVEIAGFTLIGPQSYGNQACGLGLDNITAPSVHDMWFEGFTGVASGANPVGGCAIEIYGRQIGGSFGAHIFHNRFGIPEFTTQVDSNNISYILYDPNVLQQVENRYAVWLNSPYQTDGKVNDVNFSENRCEDYLIGCIRIQGNQDTFNGSTFGSSANISSTGNQYFDYASLQMETGAISAMPSAANVVTLRTISGSYISGLTGTALAGLTLAMEDNVGAWHSYYITTAGTSGRQVTLTPSAVALNPSAQIYTSVGLTGTAQSVSSTMVQFESGLANTTPNYYNGQTVTLTSGNCSGDSAAITSYAGSSLTATVSGFTGSCVPSGTPAYVVGGVPFTPIYVTGTAQSATSTTVVLQANAITGTATGATATSATLQSGSSTVNAFYNNLVLTWTNGNCMGDSGTVTAYVGSSLIATSVSGFGSGGFGTCVETTGFGYQINYPAGYFDNDVLIWNAGANCANQSGTITGYTGGTSAVATVSFAGCTANSGDGYTIATQYSLGYSDQTSGTATAANATSATLGSGSSAVPGYYAKEVLTWTTGNCAGDFGAITGYASPPMATVSGGFGPGGTGTCNETGGYGYVISYVPADMPYAGAIGHAFYYAMSNTGHSTKDYFERTLMVTASGSNTGCALLLPPQGCNGPNAGMDFRIVDPETEVSRGLSAMFADGSYFMPSVLLSGTPTSSGQVPGHGVFGSLILTDPSFPASAAPLMDICINNTGHTSYAGDVVSLPINGGGVGENTCVDPATFNTATSGQYVCRIVTAPGVAVTQSFAQGQPMTLAMPGSQVDVNVDTQTAWYPPATFYGIAQSATTTTAVLQPGISSTTTTYYNGGAFTWLNGSCAGASGSITGYNGSTLTATTAVLSGCSGGDTSGFQYSIAIPATNRPVHAGSLLLAEAPPPGHNGVALAIDPTDPAFTPNMATQACAVAVGSTTTGVAIGTPIRGIAHQ